MSIDLVERLEAFEVAAPPADVAALVRTARRRRRVRGGLLATLGAVVAVGLASPLSQLGPGVPTPIVTDDPVIDGGPTGGTEGTRPTEQLTALEERVRRLREVEHSLIEAQSLARLLDFEVRDVGEPALGSPFPDPVISPVGARLGQPGVVVVFGNRTTYGAPFYALDLLQPGDELRIRTTGGAPVTHVVRWSAVIERTDDPRALVEDDGTTSWLLLVTQHPSFSDEQRLVVVTSALVAGS